MNELIESIKHLDFATVLTIVVATWWFNRVTRKDMKEIKEEIKSIHKEFKFINIRLSRVEGTTYGKEIYKTEEEKK